MKIVLQNVMPTPLSSIEHGEKSIWGNYHEIDSKNKVMLNASSGKGKTTFTHTLSGIRKDYSGDILFDGNAISKLNQEDWSTIRQERLAVVFQDLQLFPELTVAENLQLKNNLKKDKPENYLKDSLEFLGIGDKWNQRCGLLSMGQQQRVAIIRALCQPFEWLIMDEPFSHLDADNTKLCLQLIEERCKEQEAGFVLASLGETYGYSFDYQLNL